MTRRIQRKATPLRARGALYSMRAVADAVGWSVETTRVFLVKHKAAECIGKRFYTTRSMLRLAFPRAFTDVMATIEANRDGLDY